MGNKTLAISEQPEGSDLEIIQQTVGQLPIDPAEYKLQKSLPESLEDSLPSIEQIEKELQGDNND